MALLKLESISLTYPGDECPAVANLSLSIDQGEFLAVVGPSGCGKSSTIGLLAGLTAATSGRITLQDRPILAPGPDRAVVFQDYSLFPWMTALDNISFALRESGRSKGKPAEEKAKKLLELVGLSSYSHKYPGELSGGMRQRVAIARAFALDAPVYLLDEPFGAVDAKNRVSLQDLLLKLWTGDGNKKTVFLVTHDIDEALYLADRIAVFTPGPGRVVKTVEVPFPRPRRRFFLVKDPRYIELRNEILSLLQQEILEELQQVEGGAGI
ncbi:ABC transporter ATP-binding protein [Sporomusa acidovorans]|uniref:Nitrate import ATP-binding protein NrtD n=1 Tax=Sporomusa acidovorans (strain ATCC 49682 / DSM 3132 / Mol) TaxID=1123286 RepID=A0ABZ3IZF4_SPOA4|nr:ABC transporter ATP-binding protein [Sporomusa acidovorans]OZC16862.1 bicarbonate transport ATP-binding protein CmpD [Sporomusa acidovorans DSM 3132]SDF24609.1 NitT/TauT family transport system ATP-binding protein [Sporomusa acidovorans]